MLLSALTEPAILFKAQFRLRLSLALGLYRPFDISFVDKMDGPLAA
jgi:hypothetical protein